MIKAKRIGGPLKQKQIFQAASYAAYAGIKWAILTNIVAWQLYKVMAKDRIEPHLMFSVDMSGGVPEHDAHRLMLLFAAGAAVAQKPGAVGGKSDQRHSE